MLSDISCEPRSKPTLCDVSIRRQRGQEIRRAALRGSYCRKVHNREKSGAKDLTPRALRSEHRGRREEAETIEELRFLEEQRVVEQAGDEASRQRPNPVHALAGPVTRGDCWPKRAGGIEGRTGERAGHQNSERDGEANPEAGNRAEDAAFIYGSGEHHQHQEKGRGRLFPRLSALVA